MCPNGCESLSLLFGTVFKSVSGGLNFRPPFFNNKPHAALLANEY